VQLSIAQSGVSKGNRNQQQGYSFRGIDDIYNALAPLMARPELCILPRMLSRTQEERTTAKGGALFYVVVQAEFDFVSCHDGTKHTVVMYGEAMDSADKATNKAMSAAYKYACLQVFCIPTSGTNDADATTHEPRPKSVHNAEQQRIVAEKLASVRQPQPAARIVEEIPEPGIPEPEFDGDTTPYEVIDETELERELRESIRIAEASKNPDRRGPNRFDMLKAFGDLKLRYQRLNMERTYYGYLGQYGIEHSNQFADMAEARNCYKLMSLDVQNREARAARR
jgi:hypothetical protein